ncbi:MAG: hypothetical protein PHR06_04230 [Candidatus Cloacimonetes bacterium]|nr:hypothetical protein [Candidatus Cloacimonadota bacterium]
MEKKMGISDFINFGMENAKRYFLKFLGSVILCFVALIILAVIGYKINEAIGFILTMLGSICISIGFVQNVLNLAKNEPYDFKAFMPQPGVFLNYLLAMIIVNVIVFIGLLLFVIPGIILGLMFSMVPFLILDQKMGAMEAIKESMNLTKGHKMDIFFGYFISNLLISVISIFVITLVFTIPMSFFVTSYPYLRLSGKLEPTE